MEEKNQMQQVQAQPASQPVVSVWRNFQIDICPQHPEEKATHVCTHQDCHDNLIPICDTCLDQNHQAHPCKTLRIFCENLEKISLNSAENQEIIDKAYEAKIQNLITSIKKSRHYNTQDLAFLQNKLCEYQQFSVNNQIKRLLQKLAQAKSENRPGDSLQLHKEIKQIIKIENNNQTSFIQISRVNELRNFEQELDKEIVRIEQQHRILVDIAVQQRRTNSADGNKQAHPFDLFLAQKLYQIDQRFQKNESDVVAREQRLQQYSDQKIAEEKRERQHEINRLQHQIVACQQQQNDEIRRQEDQKIAQNLAVNNRLDLFQIDFNHKYDEINLKINTMLQRLDIQRQQIDDQIREIYQKLEQNVLNLRNLDKNNAESLSITLKLEQQHIKIQQELKSLIIQEIHKISIINQENEYKKNKQFLKIQEYIHLISSQELKLNKKQIMQDNGNKLRQQFKDMNQVLKIKIDAQRQSMGDEDARNIAAALTETPQILVLDVELLGNSIGNEGAASIVQALLTLKNLTQLTLNLQQNSIVKEGAVSIAQGLSTLTNLIQLDIRLSDNSIGKEGAVSIVQALSTLTNLIQLTLGLGRNSIGNEGAASITQALSTLTNLTQLNLGLEKNSIGNEGAATIAQALSTFTNLTQLF